MCRCAIAIAVKSVVNEAVNLNQEFRNFDFLSPWEGIQQHIDDGQPTDGNGDNSDDTSDKDKK